MKTFRLLNQACSEVGLTKLLGSIDGLGNLNCDLVLGPNITEDQMDFLRGRGSMVKRFKASGRWLLDTGRDLVRQILTELLPQMESLTVVMNVWVNSLDWKQLENRSVLEPGDTLSNLKCIRFVYSGGNSCTACSAGIPEEDQPKFLVEILTAAENLEELVNVDLAILRILKHVNKVHLVKSLVWNDPLHLYDEVLQDASLSSILQLNSLTMCCTCNDCRNNLLVVLEGSQESLTDFEVRCFMIRVSRNNQDNLILPQLKRVRSTRLHTLVCLGSMYGYSNLQALMPNLDTIIIDTAVKHLLIMVPGWAGPVKSLNVKSCVVKVDCFDNLESLFPSLKSVQVRMKSWVRGPEDAKLFAIPKTVEILEIHNFKLSTYDNYGLDELFTGRARQACEFFRRLLNRKVNVRKVAGIRKFRSKLNASIGSSHCCALKETNE